jgi:hypothetical protein
MSLGLLAVIPALGTAADKAQAPDPRLSPAEAIRIQIDALAHNDAPSKDSGIAVVWGFASPGNRAQTGPLPKFSRMIHDGYSEMLNNRGATLAATVIKDDQALQGVELVDHAGVTHRYIFILGRQSEPPFKGCWMTDGVINSPADKPALAI